MVPVETMRVGDRAENNSSYCPETADDVQGKWQFGLLVVEKNTESPHYSIGIFMIYLMCNIFIIIYNNLQLFHIWSMTEFRYICKAGTYHTHTWRMTCSIGQHSGNNKLYKTKMFFCSFIIWETDDKFNQQYMYYPHCRVHTSHTMHTDDRRE